LAKDQEFILCVVIVDALDHSYSSSLASVAGSMSSRR
jgi:hypothetical protein